MRVVPLLLFIIGISVINSTWVNLQVYDPTCNLLMSARSFQNATCNEPVYFCNENNQVVMGEECEPCRPNTCKNFTIIPPECSKGSTNIGSCDVQPALVPFPDGSVNALVTNYYNGYPDQNCSGEVVGVEYQYFNVCNYVPMFGGAWSLFLPYNNDTTTSILPFRFSIL
eukprot:Phypoly_transcript_09737.p1 GENE.Phypoly_transcript_09737~~Phypoly_transcript_09737.p1  ORF type:complete len:169 (+),score=1.67 Phypoly_transcript_09737:142-648(+)